jgi:hypothetical protein
MQVLSLALEQINSLAEPKRAAINQLVHPCLHLSLMRMMTYGPTSRRVANLWTLGYT